MKNSIKVFSILGIWIFLLANTQFSHAQNSSKNTILTDSIHVNGVCGMCKDRIENAALIKGVKKATWNKITHELSIIYKPSKVSLEDVEKSIAKAGHDTENFKADTDVYNSLPDCCAYRSGEVKLH